MPLPKTATPEPTHSHAHPHTHEDESAHPSRWREMESEIYDKTGKRLVGFRKSLAAELRHHLPFTTIAVLITVALFGVLSLGRTEAWDDLPFRGSHYAHLFVSAIATTAVFWRYSRNALVAVAVGIVSSVSFCTLSDVVLPFVGGWLMNIPTTLEFEVAEAPLWVLGFALAGSLLGFVHLRHLSVYSHSVHVFLSASASLLYLLSHSGLVWFGWAHLPAVAVLLVLSVFLPCCMSDFAMPVACTHCHFGSRS